MAYHLRLTAIFSFFIFHFSFSYAQDDTVGFWKVAHNSKEVSAVTLNGESVYMFDSIADTDKIYVFYYTESPCDKCQCKLQARGENGNELKTIQRRGYGNNIPFIIGGNEINKMLAEGKVYLYFTGKYDGWMPWIFLGEVRRIKSP